MYKAILFDLDGTLLPMSNDAFMKAYFKGLCGAFAPFGIDSQALIGAVWNGTKAMIYNDGTRTNKEIFWDSFASEMGGDIEAYIAATDPFYDGDFNKVRAVATENPLADAAIKAASRGDRKVVLATNPVFPRTAQISRLGWIGLSPERFELITDYSSDSFCKPNPQYYLSICERIGVRPEECLMVGNDETDDMMGASKAGMDCYLVTDYMIPSDKFTWTGERGTFAELVAKLEALDHAN